MFISAVNQPGQIRVNTLQLGPLVLLNPLALIPAIALLVAFFVWRQKKPVNDWRKVISDPVFDFLGGKSVQVSYWRLTLLIASLVALSMTQPALRQNNEESWRHSVSWIMVADVSRSMTLEDTAPSRLSAMRNALTRLSQYADARSVSLILFSGDAFLVAPPAFDHSVFNQHAALLEHGVITTEGSNLARALSLATAIVEGSQLVQARIFVLGDTGGISKSSLAAAHHLAKSGHRVDSLVFGADDSEEAASRSSSETIVDLAQSVLLSEAGNGVSVNADPFGAINYAPLELDDRADASTQTALRSLVWQDQSHWLLLMAIPMMLLVFRNEGAGP